MSRKCNKCGITTDMFIFGLCDECFMETDFKDPKHENGKLDFDTCCTKCGEPYHVSIEKETLKAGKFKFHCPECIKLDDREPKPESKTPKKLPTYAAYCEKCNELYEVSREEKDLEFLCPECKCKTTVVLFNEDQQEASCKKCGHLWGIDDLDEHFLCPECDPDLSQIEEKEPREVLTVEASGFEYGWVFTDTDYGLLSESLPAYLEAYGYKKLITNKVRDYLYAPGTIPILLVAHVDTVHITEPTLEQLIWFPQSRTIWSPVGLGADDRAGVAGILEIIKRGYKPHVIFLDGEERGCVGASRAIKEIKEMPAVHYAIELDRKGSQDAVFYDCDNEKFEEYIVGFGFISDWGSFSDISELCPEWKVAGVNLSTGYYNAHTKNEHLKVDELMATVDAVCLMLDSPPKKKYKYVPAPRSWGVNKNIYRLDDYSDYYDRDPIRTGTSLGTTDYDYYEEGRRGTRSSKAYSDEVGTYLSAEELSDMFGDSVEFWYDWIRENKEEVEIELERFLLDTIGRKAMSAIRL